MAFHQHLSGIVLNETHLSLISILALSASYDWQGKEEKPQYNEFSPMVDEPASRGFDPSDRNQKRSVLNKELISPS